jgi:ABC-type sulfate transport system permease component
MVKLTGEQWRFVTERRRLVRHWPKAAWFLVLIILALLVYLLVWNPLLINPFEVMRSLEEGSLPAATLALLAVFGSIAFVTCCLLILVMVWFLSVAISTERRLIDIIDQLLTEGQDLTPHQRHGDTERD